MKNYSSDIPENCACARLEGVNASYKDLSEVCGRIRKKKASWALSFLEMASEGEIPVLYKRHNKRLAHRRELGGQKGRFPKKAARIVLKLLQSAIANGRVKGLGDEYTVFAACANKKHMYPRIAPKGRWARSFLETSRVEVVVQGSDIPKGVEVNLPKKGAENKKEQKTEAKTKTEEKEKKDDKSKEKQKERSDTTKEKKQNKEKPKEDNAKEKTSEGRSSETKEKQTVQETKKEQKPANEEKKDHEHKQNAGKGGEEEMKKNPPKKDENKR